MRTMLKKIPIKKVRPDKGVKGSHPNQSMWHKTRTAEEKAAYSKKISDGMKKFYAQRKAEDAKKKSDLIKKAKKIFFESAAGREEKDYREYLSRNYQLGLEGEERIRILAKRGAGRKANWDLYTPEEKREMVAKQVGHDKLNNIIEFNVPRKKTFCGVVREDRM